MSDPIRMTAHAIGGALDFNEIDAEDVFIDAPSYDALEHEMLGRLGDAGVCINALTAEFKQFEDWARPQITHYVEQKTRITQLEAALISARNDIREAIPVTKHEYTLRRLKMGEATITAALTALEPPVSTLCAVCDQIKELHPATHPWTAKVAVAETPVAHSKSQQRRFETMGVEHVPYTKETSLSPTSPAADHLDSSSCGESSAGTGGHSSAETPANAWLCHCGLTVKKGYACIGCFATEDLTVKTKGDDRG